MNYVPHPKQVEAHNAVEEYNRLVLFWGRQVGKTLWAVNHLWMQALRQQGQYFFVLKTYTQAEQVVWEQYRHMIPEALRAKEDASDLAITFPHVQGTLKMPDGTLETFDHDESIPPSMVRFLGSDKADSHRGLKAHGLVFDEYADQNPDNWDSVYQPMFSTTDGWAVFMGTPKGYNHWYETVMDAQENPEWFFSRATWRDNPAITPEFIAKVRADAERKGRLNTFLQEYELEFRSVEGSVYPDFKRDVHCAIKPEDIPEQGAIYAAVDFGWENPTAVLFVKIDFDNNWYVFDEIYAQHTTINDLAPMIRQKIGDERLVLMVGDSAQAEHIASLQEKGFPIIPASKTADSIIRGISLISEKLKPRVQLLGDPKPKLYITKNCRHLIEEMEQYKYPEDKGKRNPTELPLKKNDHGPDALRYLALHMKYGQVERDTPLKPKMQFNEYGLL